MTKQWTLYSRYIYPNDKVFGKDYIWVDPSGVVQFARSIHPLGTLVPACPDYVGQEYKAVRDNTLPAKWTKVKTGMTQEELSKGWLT